jgi:NAD(P)-dependent dehydrogenase (short-subunit alcohol dehydrogenase family)
MTAPNDTARVAVVTGGARGLGAATARRLAQEDCRVYVADLDGESAQRFAAIDSEHLVAVEMDVADPRSVAVLARRIADDDGRFDILVNNAGVQLVKPSAEMLPSEWQSVIDVDLSGVFFTSQAMYPLLRVGGGAIVSIASVAASTAMPQRLPYVASKAGVEAITRTLAAEWTANRIRVNAVAPGYIQTDMLDAMVKSGKVDVTPVIARTSLGRLGRDTEIAAAVAWLASQEASYVTGEVLYVDGGWMTMGARPQAGPGSFAPGPDINA